MAGDAIAAAAALVETWIEELAQERAIELRRVEDAQHAAERMRREIGSLEVLVRRPGDLADVDLARLTMASRRKRGERRQAVRTLLDAHMARLVEDDADASAEA